MPKNFGSKSLRCLFKSTMLMKFLFLFFLLPLQLFAQDIPGVWVGTMYNDTTRHFIKYELAISEYDGKLSGYSHTIFVIDSVENIGVKSIKIKKSGKTFLVEDEKLVYNNYSAPPAKGVKTYCELTFSQNDSEMILSGTWITNRTKVFKSLTGNIFLRKKKNIKESLIIAKLENLGLSGTLSFMNSPDQSNELAFVNKLVSYFTKPEKSDKEIANNVVSNTKEPANSELQQAEKKDQIDKQVPEVILDKEETEKAKTGINVLPLKVADKPTKEEEKIDVISINRDSTKSGPKQIKIQAKAEEKIPVEVLKKDDIGLNKDTKKEAPSILTQAPIRKHEATNIESIKPGVQQIDRKEKEDKGIPVIVLKKDSIVSNMTVINAGPHAAAEIAKRTIETIKSVEIKSDSLLLTLYDNGVVDGDTVSVLLNGKVIMPMQGLSTKAINKSIYLTPEMGDSIVLIMYAENLGSIPPNTGLLVVHDGEDIYEIRFSGDLEKNAAIILKRKKKN